MTIGLIFECGPQGADKQVCEYLVQQLKPGIVVRSFTMDNKGNLMIEAGKVAAQLLKDGCTCVLIVWDLRPAWPDKKRPCRHAEREELLNKLTAAGLPANAPVHLICIEQELESWLLANERALSAVLSSPEHPYKVPREKKPDALRQPKAVVINYFKEAKGWRYDDKFNAIGVLRAVPIDLGRMRQSESFARFEAKLNLCVGA